jgi:hypothetical protein
MKWLSLVLAFIVGCASVKPDDISYITQHPVEEQQVVEPIVPNPPPLINYKIRIEFVLPEEEIEANPTVALGFYQAIEEWSKLIPIDAVVSTSKATDPNKTWLRDGRWNSPGVIKVRIVDLQTFLWAKPDWIGVWFGSSHQLFLDADFLGDPAFPWRPRGVAMHELGHAFGLPHVNSQSEKLEAKTGDITIPADSQPKMYMMYPIATEENIRAVPSALEIELANQYVIHNLTSIDRGSDLTDIAN